MPLKAGSTFFMSGTGGIFNLGGAHLFVCLTDPDAKGDMISVSIMTHHPNYDASCLLSVADHGFIKHKSCANYQRANKIYGPGTEKSPTYSPNSEDVSPELLARLRDGLFASENTPEFILAYAKSRGLKPSAK